MASRRGGGCALALLIIFALLAFLVWYKFFRKPEEPRPTPSGNELRVRMVDVGQGDSILIISPEGKAVLVDAGDTGRGKTVLADLKEMGVEAIDLLVTTHPDADHIGAADEIIKGITVRRVLDGGNQPPARAGTEDDDNRPRRGRNANVVLPTTKAYQDYLEAIRDRGAEFVKAELGQRFDIGGGAVITVLAPTQPLFTREQLGSRGTETNANSIVFRLDYGDFSMLFTGDAEALTEERLIREGAKLEADVLKIGHHGSRYATSESFIRRVKPEVALISNGANNRYGHPSQDVLDRLRAANVRVYRTDLQGDILITTKGGEEYEVKPGQEDATAEAIFTGRKAERRDDAAAGFIRYGDFGPAKNEQTERQSRTNTNNANNSNRRAAGGRR